MGLEALKLTNVNLQVNTARQQTGDRDTAGGASLMTGETGRRGFTAASPGTTTLGTKDRAGGDRREVKQQWGDRVMGVISKQNCKERTRMYCDQTNGGCGQILVSSQSFLVNFVSSVGKRPNATSCESSSTWSHMFPATTSPPASRFVALMKHL